MFSRAALPSHKDKLCFKCKCKMMDGDGHIKCHKCLGPYHAMDSCQSCLELPSAIISRRKLLAKTYLQTGQWSVVESAGSTTSKKSCTPPVIVNPDTVDQDQNVQGDEDIQEDEGDENDVEIVGETEPLENPSGGEDPEAGEMFEAFKVFLASKTDANKGAPKRKPTGLIPNTNTNPKKQRVDVSQSQEFINLKSQVQGLDSKMDLLLNKLMPTQGTPQGGAIPRGREGAIPKIPRLQTLDNPMVIADLHDMSQGDDNEDDEEYDPDLEWGPQEQAQDQSPEFLSRRAAREIWLAGLPDLCPKLPMVPVSQTTEKVFFKTLTQKKDKQVMPFVADVRDFCTEIQLKKYKNVVPQVEALYKTDDTTERQYLSPRLVPYALAKEVSFKALKEQGLKADQNRLAPKSNLGLQEKFALDLEKRSAAFLRVTNSFQLAFSAMGNVIEKCNLTAELLNSKVFVNKDDKKEVQESVEDLINNFNVLSLAVRDVDFTNGDFLTLAANQYSAASKLRTEAWVEATSLPKSVKKQLLTFDPDVPEKGSVGPLSIISKDAETFLTNFVQNRKDQDERSALLKSLKQPAPQKTQQAPKQQPQYKTPLNDQFQEFLKSQMTWGTGRGRGTPRGGRGGNRGKNRGKGRGRGNTRPFPKGRGNNKQ